jgi:hypothetical protein
MSTSNRCAFPREAFIIFILTLFAFTNCFAATYPTLSGTGSTSFRQWLDYTTLMQGTNNSNTVDNAAFFPPANAAMPKNTFNGTLQLNSADLKNNSKYQVLFGTKRDTSIPFDSPEMHYMPAFSFQFVQDGSNLIPVKRSFQVEDPVNGHPIWEYILGPGRVWDENTDNGYSRATFTFALTEKNQNCVHNGMMSFLFKNSGEISKVWYQITEETCAYYKIDLWGFAGATYIQGGVASAATVITNYRDEVANQLDILPIEQLATDVAGVDASVLEPTYDSSLNKVNASPNPYNNPAEHNPIHLVNYGVIYNNRIYTGITRTRSGTYPYPQWMVYPTYSWGKSEFVGNAVALLAQLNPRGVPATPSSVKNTLVPIESLLVTDWIPDTVFKVNRSEWSDVTLGHLIDMASGHFINRTTHLADENSDPMIDKFFNVLTNTEKLDFSLNYFPRASQPGQYFVYHTSDFYIATRMLELVSQKIYGYGILKLMTDNIYNRLKLSELAKNPKTTYDTVKQPWGGYGAFGYLNDIAKLGNFMAVSKGAIGGVQVLEQTRVNDVLQLNPNNQGIAGLPLGTSFRYNNGYWSKNLTNAPGCYPRIVFESGFGGLTKVLGTAGPNNPGWVYYYISDNGEFLYASAINTLASSIGCPYVDNH